MPTLLNLSRFRKRVIAEQNVTSRETVRTSAHLPTALRADDLGQKIHPNLQELVQPSLSTPPSVASPTSPPISSVLVSDNVEDNDGIVPLKPVISRQRRRSVAAPAPQSSFSTDLSSPSQPPPSPATSLPEHTSQEALNSMAQTPPQLNSQSPQLPSSWATFGKKAMRGARSIPSIIVSSRTTSEPEIRTPSTTYSPDSAPSSGFSHYTFGRGHVPSVAPPLPPLDHPAFQQHQVDALPESLKEDREMAEFFSDKKPRNSVSLPSMSSSSRVSWLKESDSRARVQDIFPDSSRIIRPIQARRKSDGTRRKRTRRSKSASILNQRVYDSQALGLSSRDGDPLGRADYGNEQARGNSSSLASGAFGLGSPFLFHSASAPETHTFTSTDNDNSIPQNNIPPAGMSYHQAKNISKTRGSSRNEKTDKFLTPPVGSSSSNPPSTLLMPPSLSVTGPTPESSPVVEPMTPSRNKGKRKADEVEGSGGTPPEAKKLAHQRTTTFAAESPRPHRASGNSSSSHSRAPSSFHRTKRARLSGSASTTIAGVMSPVGEDSSRPDSRDGSHRQNASNTGSWASRASAPTRTQSRTSGRNPSHHHSLRKTPSVAPSRNSISQASIPISALISPHAPSVSQRSTMYHTRDPRKPAPVQRTPWSLTLPEKGWRSNGVRWSDGGGSPLHAWMFFIGFVLFPLWWIAGFLVGIPKTRVFGAGEAEKGVILDDPQVEHDAVSWRKRCRIMTIVSLFTYVPFVVCVAVFAPR